MILNARSFLFSDKKCFICEFGGKMSAVPGFLMSKQGFTSVNRFTAENNRLETQNIFPCLI